MRPVLHERSNLEDIETLIQSLLPVGSVEEENVRPTADRHESTVVFFCTGNRDMRLRDVLFWMICFLSCHRDGKGIGGTMDLFYDHLRGGLPVFKRETSADPGRGVGQPHQ